MICNVTVPLNTKDMQCHSPTQHKRYAMSQSHSTQKICNVTVPPNTKDMQCHSPTQHKRYAMSQSHSTQKICNVTVPLNTKDMQCHSPTQHSAQFKRSYQRPSVASPHREGVLEGERSAEVPFDALVVGFPSF